MYLQNKSENFCGIKTFNFSIKSPQVLKL